VASTTCIWGLHTATRRCAWLVRTANMQTKLEKKAACDAEGACMCDTHLATRGSRRLRSWRRKKRATMKGKFTKGTVAIRVHQKVADEQMVQQHFCTACRGGRLAKSAQRASTV
jgi:hypothetical protein